jgi:hypothetical protein
MNTICLKLDIGTITEPATHDEPGSELTPPVTLAGWHCNLRGALPAEDGSNVIEPASPSRRFA